MSSRKPPPSSSTTQADLVLLPSLKNCLLNLPAPLVSVLLNSNTLAQNVVVELSWRQQQSSSQTQTQAQAQRERDRDGRDGKAKAQGGAVQRSVFLGWTGMGSQRKEGGLSTGRDGGKAVETVEVDATFARLLGLGEGMKVRGMQG